MTHTNQRVIGRENHYKCSACAFARTPCISNSQGHYQSAHRGEVRDEKHVLFFCKCVEVCELRMRYRDHLKECCRRVWTIFRASVLCPHEYCP